MIEEKLNTNCRSHLRKINEKIRQKLGYIPLPDAVTREIITALAVICTQNQ